MSDILYFFIFHWATISTLDALCMCMNVDTAHTNWGKQMSTGAHSYNKSVSYVAVIYTVV